MSRYLRNSMANQVLKLVEEIKLRLRDKTPEELEKLDSDFDSNEALVCEIRDTPFGYHVPTHDVDSRLLTMTKDEVALLMSEVYAGLSELELDILGCVLAHQYSHRNDITPLSPVKENIQIVFFPNEYLGKKYMYEFFIVEQAFNAIYPRVDEKVVGKLEQLKNLL